MVEEWREFTRWKSDDKPKTTPAIVMVSNLGNVKRLPYVKWNEKNNSYSKMKEHIYKFSENRGKQVHEKDKIVKNGKYQNVSIRKKTYQVHRLVAICFIPNPDNKEQVNHKDTIRNNNRVDNLEWVTNKENADHAKKNGLRPKELYDSMRKLNLYQKKQALKMRLSGVSTTEIGKIFGVSHENVRVVTFDVATEDEKKILKELPDLIRSWNRFVSDGGGIIKPKGKSKKFYLKRKKKTIGSAFTLEEIESIKREYISKHNFRNG